jgi:glycosyltransferase involved in cell wall biosynthesis
MPCLLQINVTANSGSHGKIAEEIGQLAISRDWRSVIAYGRWANLSRSELLRISSDLVVKEHALESRLFDNHGLASRKATKDFIERIKIIKPDIIQLHNIHGYYINYRILFDYLSTTNIPIVWTLHDCWPFTGHCSHFEYDRCFKWKEECNNCQFTSSYPASYLLERSRRNYRLKKQSFTSLTNLTLVPVSNWLESYLKESFLSEQRIRTIHNGVDLNVFKPNDTLRRNNVVELLGVASNWKMRKGLPDFYKLRKGLPENYHITLIGLSKTEIVNLPKGIVGVERTNSVEELVRFYNNADILVNPTYDDNFPTVNLEAMACGTPVLTYRTGGSPEAVSSETGWVVEQGDVSAIVKTIEDYSAESESERLLQRIACRKRAELLFDKNKAYQAYLDLYDSLLFGKQAAYD